MLQQILKEKKRCCVVNTAFLGCPFRMFVPWVLFLSSCVFPNVYHCCVHLVNPDIFGRVELVQCAFFPLLCNYGFLAGGHSSRINTLQTQTHHVLSLFRQAGKMWEGEMGQYKTDSSLEHLSVYQADQEPEHPRGPPAFRRVAG